MKLLNFFYFCGSFCPPGSRSSRPKPMRIHARNTDFQSALVYRSAGRNCRSNHLGPWKTVTLFLFGRFPCTWPPVWSNRPWRTGRRLATRWLTRPTTTAAWRGSRSTSPPRCGRQPTGPWSFCPPGRASRRDCLLYSHTTNVNVVWRLMSTRLYLLTGEIRVITYHKYHHKFTTQRLSYYAQFLHVWGQWNAHGNGFFWELLTFYTLRPFRSCQQIWFYFLLLLLIRYVDWYRNICSIFSIPVLCLQCLKFL